MQKDFLKYARMIDSMRQQFKQFTRTLDLFNVGNLEIASRQMQEYQDSVSRILYQADYSADLTGLLRSAQRLQELNLDISADLKKSLDRVHDSWFFEWKDAIRSSEQVATMAKMALADASYHTAVAKPFWDGIDFDVIRKDFNIQDSLVSEMQSSMSTFTASYRHLTESFQDIADLVKLPSFILPGATRELSVTSYALEALQLREKPADEAALLETEIIEESDVGIVGLSSLLEGVEPGLASLYIGAIDSLNGNNPDRERHVLTSLRTLWSEIFQVMAPNGAVKAWIKAKGLPTQDYLHDGRPTRHAKLKYVLKNVSSDPLTDFVDADIRAALKLYKLYNRIHNRELDLTDQQLRVIVLKSETSLDYFIRIWKW